MPQNSVKAIPLVTFNSAGLLATYLPLNGPDGLPEPCFWLQINNESTVNIIISFDGVTDHMFCENGSIFPFFANFGKLPKSEVALFRAHQIIYAKSAAPGVGNIYISGFYV